MRRRWEGVPITRGNRLHEGAKWRPDDGRGDLCHERAKSQLGHLVGFAVVVDFRLIISFRFLVHFALVVATRLSVGAGGWKVRHQVSFLRGVGLRRGLGAVG
jgi:hypothetical protein